MFNNCIYMLKSYHNYKINLLILEQWVKILNSNTNKEYELNINQLNNLKNLLK